MGWNAQPTRQVPLDGVRLPADRLLGGEGNDYRIAMAGLNGGRLGIAAYSLGGAKSTLERSTAYLGERHAFGARLLNAHALQSVSPAWRPSWKRPGRWCGGRPPLVTPIGKAT